MTDTWKMSEETLKRVASVVPIASYRACSSVESIHDGFVRELPVWARAGIRLRVRLYEPRQRVRHAWMALRGEDCEG